MKTTDEIVDQYITRGVLWTVAIMLVILWAYSR